MTWVHRAAEEAEAQTRSWTRQVTAAATRSQNRSYGFSPCRFCFLPQVSRSCAGAGCMCQTSCHRMVMWGQAIWGRANRTNFTQKYWARGWAPPAAKQGMIWQRGALPKPACPSDPSICLNLPPRAWMEGDQTTWLASTHGLMFG